MPNLNTYCCFSEEYLPLDAERIQRLELLIPSHDVVPRDSRSLTFGDVSERRLSSLSPIADFDARSGRFRPYKDGRK